MIGSKMKHFRQQKKLTQKKLGELCGLSEGMIRQYELGLRNPKIETIQKIAVALEVSPNRLSDDSWTEIKEETRKMIDFHSFIHDFLKYNSPYCDGAKEVDILLEAEPDVIYRIPASIYEDFMESMPEQIANEFSKMLKWSQKIQVSNKEYSSNNSTITNTTTD